MEDLIRKLSFREIQHVNASVLVPPRMKSEISLLVLLIREVLLELLYSVTVMMLYPVKS